MAPANVKCLAASRRTSVDELLFVMARSLARAPEACNGVKMEVPRYDYAAQFGDDIGTLLTDIGRMLIDGRYILTDEVREFENAFGAYLGASYVYGVGSGTDALILALMALGIRAGDEVIIQANTFYATAAAVRLVGAVPVLVDACLDSYLIDDEQVGAAVTSRTRAVIPVHLYGKPTPLERLRRIAVAHGFEIVEDAAQAHGARIQGRAAGTLGTIGCFSFHPSKSLAAAGDGGAVATNSESLAHDVRRRRELGQEGQGNHVLLGINSKLDAIQARILNWKMPRLESWNSSRRRIAAAYRERLCGLPLTFQATSPDEEHAYHLFPIQTAARDSLMTFLRQAGVDVVVRYPYPIHLQPAFAHYGWRRGQFPIAESLASELLCLPIHPTMSIDEIDYVCDQIRLFFGRA
jgi:dTDP-4-amino-4,6-dideoxygalactose transaminase